MTKQYDPTNRYWWETEGNNTRIGFAPKLLEQLGECFHILPSRRRSNVREKGPLMAVETAGELFSIPSPVAGIISFFDDRAMNFPDQIKEDDVVCIVKSTDAKATVKKPSTLDDERLYGYFADPAVVGAIEQAGFVNEARAAAPLHFNANLFQALVREEADGRRVVQGQPPQRQVRDWEARIGRPEPALPLPPRPLHQMLDQWLNEADPHQDEQQ